MIKHLRFCVVAALLVLSPTMALSENIGMAREPQPNERAQALTKIFMTLVGTWAGTYTYFDERAGKNVSGPGQLVFATTAMPNVMTLDAKTERPGGPPVHALTMMVMQADGSSWRQMAFTPGGGRLQDKTVTAYTYTSDREWSVEFLEVQQGLGGQHRRACLRRRS